MHYIYNKKKDTTSMIVNPFDQYLQEEENSYSCRYDFDLWGLYKDNSNGKLTYHSIDLIQFLKEHSNYIIEIQVQTDCRGDEKDNLRRSQQYAKSIKKFLLKQGIKHQQIIPKGMGEEALVNCNCDDLNDVFLNCSEIELKVANRVTYKLVEIK